MRVPTSGGTPSILVPSSGGGSALAVDATGAYYSAAGGILRAPLAGGAPTVLAPTPASAMTLTSSSVLWTTPEGDVLSLPLSGAPEDAGAPALIASQQNYPEGIAASAGRVYWATNGTLSNAGGFAPLTGGVTSAPSDDEADGGVVGAGALDAGPGPRALVSGQSCAYAIAVDATNVYWTDLGTVANGYTDGAVLNSASARRRPRDDSRH